MSTQQELIKRDDSADVIGVAKLGDIFTRSGYFRDVRDQAQAVVKILYGRELGFSPVVSMMGIHVIEGKPSLSSNLLGTLVKRSGKYDYRVTESTDKACRLEFFVCGAGKRESLGFAAFTIEDAQRANLVKPNSGWAKYPKAMLFARALSAGVRLHCPDVSACPLYVPEELGATVDEEGAVTELPKSARPVDVTTEDIEIGGHGNQADAVSKGTTTAPDKPFTPELPIEESLPVKEPSVEYITVNQQKNFHRECRAAVKPARSNEADSLTYTWLTENGYVDENKLPTAARIPAAGWLATRNNAVEWLRNQ